MVPLLFLFGCDWMGGGGSTVKRKTVSSKQKITPPDSLIEPVNPPPGGANCHLSAPQIFALSQVPTNSAKTEGTGALAVYVLDSSATDGSLTTTKLAEKSLADFPQSGDVSVDGDGYAWASQKTGDLQVLKLTNASQFAIGGAISTNTVGVPVSVVQSPDGFFTTSWNASGSQGFYAYHGIQSTPLAFTPTGQGPHDVKLVDDLYYLSAEWSDGSVRLLSKGDGHEIWKMMLVSGANAASEHPRWLKAITDDTYVVVGQNGSVTRFGVDASGFTIAPAGSQSILSGATYSNAAYSATDSLILATYVRGSESGIAAIKVGTTLSAPKTSPLGTTLRDILSLGDGVYVAGDIGTSELVFFRSTADGTISNVKKVPLAGMPQSLSVFRKQICLEGL